MTPEVKMIAMAFRHGSPAAGSRFIARTVREMCSEKGLPVPSIRAVQASLAELPEQVEMTRGGDVQERDRPAKAGLPMDPTTYANQRFQADQRLDIWGRIRVDDVWTVVEVSLTLLLDDFSRAVPGIAFTVGEPMSWSLAQALRHAILPKKEPGWPIFGLPEVIRCDGNPGLPSPGVRAGIASLGIQWDMYPSHHHPIRMGKVERFFRSLEQNCLRALPGHMDAIGRIEGAAERVIGKLLTVEQIEHEIKRWITEDYHHRTHPATGRKPLELWQETAHPRLPEEDEVSRAFPHEVHAPF